MSRYTSISISIFGMILLAVCVLANENLEKINEPLEAEASSNLSKYVKILSKPGAFNKPLWKDEEQPTTKCPPGEEGLPCRRAEARWGSELFCPQGDCSVCRECKPTKAAHWPRCCQVAGRCCSQVATACLNCNVTSLSRFCNKAFKRCFTPEITSQKN